MEKFAAFSAESWMYAAKMTVLGMGMIFAVLSLLWGILVLFKVIFVKRDTMPKVKELQKEAVKELPEVVKQEAGIASEQAATDDAVIAAVITAAVAAYMAEQGISEDGFRVVSFKRAQNQRAWNSK